MERPVTHGGDSSGGGDGILGLRTPVLVNGRCAVTKEFVEKSDGGLWYDDYPTFETALRRLEGDADLRKGLGR